MLRQALRANLFPALILWIFAALLLFLFHFHAPTHAALTSLAALKAHLGLRFSMPAQAICAALIPFGFERLQRGDHRKTAPAHLPYLMLFWAFQGATVDLFYGFEAHLFGNNSRPITVMSKVAFDMLLYTPAISMPLVALAFAWKDNAFSLSKTLEPMGKAWYLSRVLPLYGAAFLVWTPAVAVVYALPLALQFPVQAVVTCFWSLIVVIMTGNK